MKQRIWELDVFRGICILGMVVIHFVYDLVELYGLLDWQYPRIFSFVKNWGGVLFLLLSGTCATLSSHSVRRGILVFSCGMLCSAVTAGMYLLGFADQSIMIWFGVLHCLGICMMLWPLFNRPALPVWVLGLLGALLVIGGLMIRSITVPIPWLFPLGLTTANFSSSDFFPLLPNLGFFLLGAVIGRTLYREKTTRLPHVPANAPVLRFLGFCGRTSLPIYLLHQPVLSVVCLLLCLICNP